MNHTTKTAARASLNQLQGLATQGVERALAARMTELNAEQVQAVSGGAVSPALSLAVSKRYLINGIINPEILKQIQTGGISQPVTNPGLPGAGTAAQGILIGL